MYHNRLIFSARGRVHNNYESVIMKGRIDMIKRKGKKRGRKSGFKVSKETKRRLRAMRIDPKVTERREKIFNYFMENGYDLKERTPRGLPQTIVDALDMRDTAQVKDDVKIIRRQCGISRNPKGSFTTIGPTSTGVHDYLVKHNMFRASLKETPICDKIINFLNGDKLPCGGVGLLTGTPSPLSLLKKIMEGDKTMYNSSIIWDNLEVANILQKTTHKSLRITVGNAYDKIKAEAKAYLWRSLVHFGPIVKTGRVDSASFENDIRNLVERYSLVKVVLLTSGVWKHSARSRQKYPGLDLKFETPAIKLTRKYKNLHILAMCKKSRSFDFELRYLHNSQNIVLP